MDDFETRLRILEDIEAIRRLKAHYCAACDADYDADAIAALFTEDAVWDGGGLGFCEGREAIRRFFSAAPSRTAFAIHYVANPLIEVTGDTATGQWLLWQPMTRRAGDEAFWLGARYDDEYVRRDGAWLFARVTVTVRTLSPYAAGFQRPTPGA